MKIFIATGSKSKNEDIDRLKHQLIDKFNELTMDNFVEQNPNIIFFASGGSEHYALSVIETEKRYCFLATKDNNSWAAAAEVKACLNEKGVKTKIFDLDSLNSFAELKRFMTSPYDHEKEMQIGLVGEPSPWLVAGMPPEDLMADIFKLKSFRIESEILDGFEKCNPDYEFLELFDKETEEININLAKLHTRIKSIISDNNLDVLMLNCFDVIKKYNISPCLSFSVLNSNNFPAVCEGDFCSAAGIIVASRILGKIPWMANLTFVSREYASFAHCTAPLNMLNGFSLETHFESGLDLAIAGNMPHSKVTVFRIDSKMETCFISLGQVIDHDLNASCCRTSVRIKMSAKSLFLLREFPLGNHHLIIFGDHTDTLANYYSEKGFRIT